VIVLGLAAYLLPKMFASPSDQVQVPRLAGLTENAARAKVVDAGLTVGSVEHAYSTKVPANRVIDQDPPADGFVDKGTSVTFTISSGAHPTKVPNIIGQSRDDAQSSMDAAHLNPVFKRVDSDQAKGTVVSTDPPVGTQVARDSDVTVNLSLGPQKVPDLVGKTQEEAEALLKERGFTPQVSQDNSSTEPKGTVTGQTPPAGTHLPQGSTVFITVSNYEPTSPPTSEPTSEPTSPPTSLPTGPISPS
jgi:beta-lactam-binding protein with PASTA domain